MQEKFKRSELLSGSNKILYFDHMETLTATPNNKTHLNTSTQRFQSLDAFRGLTIAGMILVNTPGSWQYVYAPLRHAPWNGCTPTDLVFPFFLFAVGNAMAFSMAKYQALGSGPVLRKIFTRTALIFAIGIFLNWFPFVRWVEDYLVFRQVETLRIFGVLQRIALAYMGAALIVHYFKPMVAFIWSVGLLFAFWVVLLLFGDLTLEGNAVLKLDLWLLGENHMYKGYFSEMLDRNIAFEPEGLLSTIPAIASVIFGFLAGKYIKAKGNSFEMLSHLFSIGLLSIFLGMCWDLVFPINKPIWSSSYVLYTTGLAMVILSMIIFFTDMKGQRSWSLPFMIMGRNPLLLFALSGMLARLFGMIYIGESSIYGGLYRNIFQPVGGNYFGSLLFAVAQVLVFLVIGWMLDRRKIYLRV